MTPSATSASGSLSRAAPWLIAVASGALLGLAYPKFGLAPLAWFALAPLIVLARRTSPARAWGLGLVFGGALRAVTLYWVIHAMTRFGGLPLPVALVAAGALVAYLAVYQGLFAMVVARVDDRLPGAPFVLAATWVGLELVQARLLTGFPWMLLGYAAGGWLPLLQTASVSGVYGLSFVLVLVNAGIAMGWMRGRRAVPGLVAVAAVVVVAVAHGFVALSRAPAPGAEATGDAVALRVALVQGNIAQDTKWDAEVQSEILRRHLDMTRRGLEGGADLVVWPESSWPDPYGLERNDAARAAVGDLARTHAGAVLVGTVRLYEAEDRFEVANAGVVVDADGEVGAAYEKVQLVPFGEYLPLRRWLPALGALVRAVGELRAGAPDQELLAADGAGVPRLGLAICYEVIFPGLVREQVRRGATFLATITNDAWYGTTSGPYQHFAMARFRAVENRRYLVRAANTGISGIIDPWGRVIASTRLEEEALVEGVVRTRLDKTPYVVVGDAFALVCAALASFGLVAVLRPSLLRRLPPPVRSGLWMTLDGDSG